jgi:hypothetical protein
LKERCGLESQTDFFPFKKSPKPESVLDARTYIYIYIYKSHSVPCVWNNRHIEVNGLYSRSVLSGFNIMIDRQRKTKYTDSNGMARGDRGGCVTRVDVAPTQE